MKHVEEQGLDNVVAVMPQRDARGAQTARSVVQDAAPQPRTHRAEGLALGGQRLDHTVGVLLDHVVLDTELFEILRQHVFGKVRLLLVDIDRHQFEVDRRMALQVQQDVQ